MADIEDMRQSAIEAVRHQVDTLLGKLGGTIALRHRPLLMRALHQITRERRLVDYMSDGARRAIAHFERMAALAKETNAALRIRIELPEAKEDGPHRVESPTTH